MTVPPLTSEVVPGIDEERVSEWLAAEELVAPPLRFRRVGEGQSNLTFRIDDARGAVLVLRRPPLGEILASAHDVLREHRILSMLAAAGARVPRPVAACADASVTNAPFYVMEHVDGSILTTVAAVEQLSLPARRAVAPSVATTLAELHALDLDAVGLADMRRDESLGSRQLRRWTRQWEASKTRELPHIDEVAAALAERLPPEAETVLLHGDYHLHNLALADDGTIRAVLDWELCSVGDPLADVGQMIAYWGELGAVAGTPAALFREPVTTVEGIATAPELLRHYAEASGRDVSGVAYWVAFAYWKIAIIVEGVYRRWLNDPTNGSNAGTLQPAVDRLAADALAALATA